MTIKGIIFDLDGVIVSTDEFHYLGWKKIADEEDIYFDRDINNKLRGVSRMESLNILLEKSSKEYSTEEKNDLAERKNKYYVNLLSNLSSDSILPNVKEVLDELKKCNYKLAIGSSSKNTPIILEKIGLSNYFQGVADGNGITHSKPDPEVFLLASKKIGLKPGECAVVEDAKSGIDAANAWGMTSIAISDAYGYEIATYSLKDIRELLDVIK